MARDKLMPEIYLRQPGLTHSACEPFIKNKARKQELKETGDNRYIYQSKLEKAWFQHDVGYGTYKNQPRRTAS